MTPAMMVMHLGSPATSSLRLLPSELIPSDRSSALSLSREMFVPHLGTDQVFQFMFNEKDGKLSANTPPIVQMKAGSGPRHIIVSRDNLVA